MKKFVVGVGAALGMLFGSGVASAQNIFYGNDHFLTCAFEIAAGGEEQYAIGCHHSSPEGKILRRTSSGWQQFATGTTATQIAVSATGVPWILRSNGSAYKWNGSSFTRKGTSSNCWTALSVGVVDTNAWALGCSGTSKRVYRYDGSNWVEPEPTARAIDIAVGSDNAAWLLTDTNQAYRWNGSRFEFISSNVFVVGGNGWVVADQLDAIWRYTTNGGWARQWKAEDSITDLTADGAFAIHANGEVWNRTDFSLFAARANQTGGIEVTVLGRYFDPNKTIQLSWLTPGGELRPLTTVPAQPTGVVGAFNVAVPSATTCRTVANLGLHKSNGPQTMYLQNFPRVVTITNHALRDACWSWLPN